MKTRTSTRLYRLLSLACLVVLLLAPVGGAALATSQAAPVPPVADQLVTGTVTLPPGADVIVELPALTRAPIRSWNRSSPSSTRRLC